ncbi:RelA/SpoT domain-containing protein [Microbulbifer rhizosphaerae]|uniref:PpGpp synthetase/RelA/SpoT-type nucleotidyltransferase n=1 Tax=Microbulbifer rhizosphaerae TaxID=1562603 RepID=A0A7W4Z8L4_9GAMM|nr:RelA/SpoT domain-containing protein [Microbulbifer rhizosphaerae]MBB3059275.1 ppGpp synthetase/RelA/SpoT-type nucleotidyltransferase [Microbulbifer rhizosphaerae]
MNDFPGGSRSRVNKAGERIREATATEEDLRVIDSWRAAHRGVLNTFQAVLRMRTRQSQVVVAQRHKRKSTIIGKLHRFPKMQLSRMDDVAGCRLIFPSIEELYQFREKLHKARFKHELKNDVDRYDYIKSPKSTGYRGVHDIYSYDVKSDSGSHLKGLMVELQYRTNIQHAWATAVEVIGFITESQPKFQEGDSRYEEAMALAGEILARAFENNHGPHRQLTNDEVVRLFLAKEREIGLLNMLRSLNSSDTDVSKKRNTILIFSDSGDLEVHTYKDATDALRALFELERQADGRDIVLVRADTSDEIRFAFKNYFSDATDFINLVGQGCEILSGRRVISESKKRVRKKKPAEQEQEKGQP